MRRQAGARRGAPRRAKWNLGAYDFGVRFGVGAAIVLGAVAATATGAAFVAAASAQPARFWTGTPPTAPSKSTGPMIPATRTGSRTAATTTTGTTPSVTVKTTAGTGTATGATGRTTGTATPPILRVTPNEPAPAPGTGTSSMFADVAGTYLGSTGGSGTMQITADGDATFTGNDFTACPTCLTADAPRSQISISLSRLAPQPATGGYVVNGTVTGSTDPAWADKDRMAIGTTVRMVVSSTGRLTIDTTTTVAWSRKG